MTEEQPMKIPPDSLVPGHPVIQSSPFVDTRAIGMDPLETTRSLWERNRAFLRQMTGKTCREREPADPSGARSNALGGSQPESC